MLGLLRSTSILRTDPSNSLPMSQHQQHDMHLKHASRCCVQADVNVKMVMGLRINVKKRVNIADVPAGLNVRRLIEKAVYEEMVAMLDRLPFQQQKVMTSIRTTAV